MGRPKRTSKAGTPSRNSRAHKSAGSASSEGSECPPNCVVNLPEEHQHWEFLPTEMEDFPQSSSDPTALLPFSMDKFSQFETDDYCITVDDNMNVASATSQIGASNRNTPQTGAELLNTALSMDFEHVNNHEHQDNSHSQPSHSPSSQQDFGFGSMGIHTTPSSLVSPVDTTDAFAVDYFKGSDESQVSSIRGRAPSYRDGKPCHCNCSQAALVCLDKISTVPSKARYIQHLETIQSAFLTAEKLVLCTHCTPNMIIARCFIVMGKVHELTIDLSSQLDETMDNMVDTRHVKEDIKRVKRRASMLFGGLRMLQDQESGDWNIQSGFLLELARSWSSIAES
ncbi:hypothetical protein OPT61_g6390 [Boeremia exigua]|uniref:Uncharacterized protein n=1 Tax=Boeremia exigua TaxID=749465 RepID=A0ACC2I733_9PLEO|nr:hypothetical protein OPT61_g6390 [Boeremia exigua]